MRGRLFSKKASALAAAFTFTTAGLAGLYLRSEYEKDHFVTESMAIYSPKVRRRHRLVFLTDLHDKEFGPDNERLISAARELKPEAFLIGGDMMVAKPGKADLAVTKTLLEALSGIAPVFYADGNHEQRLREQRGNYPGIYEEFLELLKKCGVIYLSDSSAFIDYDIRVSGFNLDERYYKKFFVPSPAVSEITGSIGAADHDCYQILLAHSPLFFDTYADWGADLTLTGHFHGGTINIPGLGGLMTPQYQFFSPYCSGTFRKGDKIMISGRGLGTHSINIRLADMPQICVFEIAPNSI